MSWLPQFQFIPWWKEWACWALFFHVVLAWVLGLAWLAHWMTK